MTKLPEGNPALPEGETGRVMLDRMNGGEHEALANWAFSYVQFDDVEFVLDIGCGGGANVKRLSERMPYADVVGVDLSPLAVEKSREYNAKLIEEGRVSIDQGDVADLGQFANSTFDLITAFETIYFWKDVRGALEEIKRLLIPGGAVVICNEADGSDSDHYFLAMSVPGMTIYTPRELDELLTDAGFKKIRVYDDVKTGHVCVVAQKAKMPQKL